MKNTKKLVALFVAASMVFSLAACSDKGGSKKDKKDKGDDETTAVVDAAEAYTKALKNMDSSKLEKLSTEIDDEFISDMEEAMSGDESDIFSAIMDKVEFEIDEESAEVKKKAASIDVEYTYCDLSKISISSPDEFEDAIDDCDDTKSGKFTIEFEIDDDDYLVSNSDDIMDKFYGDVVAFDSSIYSGSGSTSGSASDFDADYTFFVYTDTFYAGADESLEYYAECYDYPDFDGETLTAVLTDPDDNEIYSTTLTFTSNEELYVTVSPADCGLSEFAEGDYYLTVSYDNYDYSDYTWITVEAASGNSDAPILPASAGYVDGNTYYNTTYGIKFDFSEDLSSIDPAMLGGALDGEDFTVDFIVTNASGSFIGFTLCGTVDGADQVSLEELAAGMGATGTDNTIVSAAGLDFINFSAEGYTYYLTLDDGVLFGLCFLTGDEDAHYMDEILASMEAL